MGPSVQRFTYNKFATVDIQTLKHAVLHIFFIILCCTLFSYIDRIKIMITLFSVQTKLYHSYNIISQSLTLIID